FCTSELNSDSRRERHIAFTPKSCCSIVSWRPSRVSLRNIPFPKPVALMSLPDPPAVSSSVGMTLLPNNPPIRFIVALTPPFSPRSPAFSDSGADTHKLHHQCRASSPARSESITSSARMRSRMDALACLKSNFMSMSDGEDEEGDGESNRRDIIVTRPRGEEIRLAPTICVEGVGLMGDVEDEGAEEGQSPPNSLRPGPDDNQRIRKRFSPSPARSVPLFLSGTRLVVGPSASASSNVVGASPASTAMFRGRKRRSTLESWFPLRSFIDLKADPDERVSSWKWRSFIEIGVA
ncbi:hypothetical protein BKA82DRAFT_4099791, partial [Pisolithus tinctorius]